MSYILYVCWDILENTGLFVFGTVIKHNRDLMDVKYMLAVCQNVVFMCIILYILYVCSDISEMNQQILFMLDTMINQSLSAQSYHLNTFGISDNPCSGSLEIDK